MATKQVAVNEEDPLKKQFQTLEEDWNSYKNSIPRHRRTISDGHDNKTLTLIGNKLIESSPEKLFSSLQRCQPDNQRSRKIEGRNLMEALESAKSDDGNNASPICSFCSSGLIHGVEGDGDDGSDSSSDCDVSVGSLKGRRSGEERWVVKMIRVLAAVWMAAVGIMLAMGVFAGEGNYHDYVTPT